MTCISRFPPLCYSLLRGAEDIAIRKPVKSEFGGGMKEFVFEDQEYFEGVRDKDTFFTSQERQAIVRNMLYNLRAVDGDGLGKAKFLEGQAIGGFCCSHSVILSLISQECWL